MRCKRPNCGGSIVNLGWYAGCLSCSRPFTGKVIKERKGDVLVDVLMDYNGFERIEHKGILHLQPITGDRKEAPVWEDGVWE
jgi:hypothetical protein